VRIVARPLRPDGTELLGTLGTVSGNYQSARNFIRYNRPYLTNPHGYVIFRNDGGGSLTELARTAGAES
jgi:hypothetical protein